MAGTWVGTLEAQGAEFPFAITFERVDGALRADMHIIASLSPDMEVADLRVLGDTVRFSLPLSVGGSFGFSGIVTPTGLEGVAVYSEDENTRGNFILQQKPFESLPAWARGKETWAWPDAQRTYWPTETWRLVDPSIAGLDAAALTEASEAIRVHFPTVHALLIVHRGLLAWEEYFHGGSVNEPINIKSASKVIIAALVGVASREGRLGDAHQKVAELVPQYFESVRDPRKSQIRLRHLLDMTTGLRWVENGRVTMEWAERGHSSRYYVSLPFDCPPGHCFIYSTASTHLLSEIISRTTKMTTRAFAEKHLFDPIGLEIADWWRSASGVHIGGAEVLMTARDMARLGFLFLNQGTWDGQEIIPAAWVGECAAYHSEGQPFVGSYGYGWWRKSIDGHPALLAKGYGGQLIVLVPDSDLVVVVGSDVSSARVAPALEHWVCQSVVSVALSAR